LWQAAAIDQGEFQIQPFRPRVEADFVRIERWTHRSTGDTWWKTVLQENVTSIYGRSRDARVADPTNDLRIFRWLLEETRDDRYDPLATSRIPEWRDRAQPLPPFPISLRPAIVVGKLLDANGSRAVEVPW